ncbi:hypothetical protein DIPPA_16898 [Diplonema papillatum]|nr:hypothetical protein DIPPA_16898 [Diplonema papillatum]
MTKDNAFASFKRAGAAIQRVLFSSKSPNDVATKYQPDADTGKITVRVTEVDFVASHYTKLLRISNYDLTDSASESTLIEAMENVVTVLRSNPVQRRLVRRQLFYDSETERKPPDPRVLAGNLKDYFNFVLGSNVSTNPAFAELTIELLAIFLLGSSTDCDNNEPKVLESMQQQNSNKVTSLAGKNNDGRKPKNAADNADGAQKAVGDSQSPPQTAPAPHEIAYTIKCGVAELLDTVIFNETRELGLPAFIAGTPTQTFCWCLALYGLMVENEDTMLHHAYSKNMVRVCWEVIAHKVSIRSQSAPLVVSAKTHVLPLLNRLGTISAPMLDEKLSINMINLNKRSVKELTKLLHHYPSLHATILSIMTLVGQKECNSKLLKELGMLEYLTTKVLPFFSSQHSKGIPQLVILLNSWIVHYNDLRFFFQFNGIQCLVYHMKTATAGDYHLDGSPVIAGQWEDMILHGISILYKLSDAPEYHSSMMKEDCMFVLLEALRILDPLKSMYHLNCFIGALYSLRNLTANSTLNRNALVQNESFMILTHLLTTPSLPISCLVHLLFLFSTLSKDHRPGGSVDDRYRHVVVNTLFVSIFKPLCKILHACPMHKVLDDSQLTIICLALQTITTLIATAKQENPLLCIQIEYDLPLENLKIMAKSDSQTPFPDLANEVLGMVYLMP